LELEIADEIAVVLLKKFKEFLLHFFFSLILHFIIQVAQLGRVIFLNVDLLQLEFVLVDAHQFGDAVLQLGLLLLDDVFGQLNFLV